MPSLKLSQHRKSCRRQVQMVNDLERPLQGPYRGQNHFPSGPSGVTWRNLHPPLQPSNTQASILFWVPMQTGKETMSSTEERENEKTSQDWNKLWSPSQMGMERRLVCSLWEASLLCKGTIGAPIKPPMQVHRSAMVRRTLLPVVVHVTDDNGQET